MCEADADVQRAWADRPLLKGDVIVGITEQDIHVVVTLKESFPETWQKLVSSVETWELWQKAKDEQMANEDLQ